MARKRSPAAAADIGEQLHMPGMEPVMNKRIHPAAKRYALLRNQRIAAGKDEKDAHTTLLGIMKEEGVESYEYGNLTVAIDKAEKCKVVVDGKPKKDDDED